MVNEDDRRPLTSRNTRWAGSITRKLAKTSITPNQISIASMGAATIAALLFFMAGQTGGALNMAGLIGGALFCQVRLLCNLLDGMVAIEAGKGAPDGAFWNEGPDRFSDIVILVGIGYGVGVPTLGWAAGAFAVLTAYVRELGRASGQPADFSGPMAKPHRMATVTIAVGFAVFAPFSFTSNQIMLMALWIIAIAALGTAITRSARLIAWLNETA